MLLKRKISLFLLCFTALWQVLFSQQQSNSSQFFWNQFLINPAYTGTLHYNPIQLGYRKQWQNFNGSPETFTFGGHAALNKNMGIGGMVIKDNMGGAFSQTAFNTQFSYRIHFGIGNFISAGATALLNQVVFDNSKITTLNSNDPTFQGTVQKSTAPDFSFGLLLQLKHNFQFGLSSQQITQGKLTTFNSVPGQVNTLLRQYNAQLAYRYRVSKNLAFETSALLKTTDIKLMQTDVNVKAWYQNMVMLGAAYRNDDAVSILAAFKYKKIFFAYSFDITTSTIRAYQNGTHEIIIGYHFQNRHNPPPDTSFKKKSGRKFIAQVLLNNNKPVDHLKLFLVDKNGSVQDSATTNNKGKFLFYLLDSLNNYMIDAEELNNDFSDKKYKIVKDKKVIAVSTSLNGKHRFNFRPLDAEKPILNEQKEEEGNFEAFVFYQKKNEPVDHLKLMLLDKYGKTIDSTFTDVLGKFKFTHVDSIKNFSIEASEDQAELSDKKYKMVKDGKTIAVSTPFNGKHRFNFRPLEAEQPQLVVEEVKEDDFIAFVYYQNNDKAVEQLKLFLLDKYGVVKDSATTDKSGKFKFRHLDNISNYLIEADDKDGALQNKKYKIVKDGKVIAESVPFNGKHRFNFKPLEAEQPKLEVEEINEDDFTAFVYYQYNDKAVEQLKLLLLDKYGAVKDSAITDKSGKFKFRHLENIGNYLIEADDKDGALQNKKYKIVKDGKVIAESTLFNGKHRFEFQHLIADKPQLKEEEVSDNSFDFKLQEKEMDGELLINKTTPFKKVKVYLVNEKGQKVDSTFTDDKGKFKFKHLSNAAQYLVEVDENDTQLKQQDFNLKLDEQLTQQIKTADGKLIFKKLNAEAPVLKDEQQKETNLDGIILAKNNAAIPRVKVYLVDKNGVKRDSVYTDEKGKFAFKQLDNAANYLIEVDEQDSRIKDQLFTIKQNGKSMQIAKVIDGKKLFKLLDADAPKLVDEKINDALINGQLYSAYYKIIANAKVYLKDKSGNKIDSVYTDEKGKFVFRQLEKVGNYLIEVDEQDSRIKEQVFILKQNGKTNVVKKNSIEPRVVYPTIDDKNINTIPVTKNSIPDFISLHSTDDDKDGIINHDDLCPHLAGDNDNKGCPALTKAQLDAIAKATHEIEFENNSCTITRASYPAIDSLVSILKSDTHLKLRITGHTDAIGDDLFNVALSKKRAESIANQLKIKGVSSSSIEIEYFGKTKPIGDNNSEEGRKKNRRVEFLFIYD